MKRLLIVSPHFPPVNAPDLHRVRQSLRYYRQFGWEPAVLAVDPQSIDGYRDDTLMRTLPDDVAVRRAVAPTWPRRLGINAIGLRAFGSLARAGSRWLAGCRADLVMFSTTAFPLMTLGARWRRRHGVPYVLDLQDPWYTGVEVRPGKYPVLSKAWLARCLHGALEPIALQRASGIMAVSPDYVQVLRARYPHLAPDCCRVIPFGVAAADYALAGAAPARDGTATVALYAGAVNPEMLPVVELVFRALRRGRDAGMPGLGALKLKFVGTNYAPQSRARSTVMTLARDCGVADLVSEDPARAPYLETLREVQGADVLLVFGSTTPAYLPSKLYQYAQSGRPIFAICHERSPLVAAYRSLYGQPPVTFAGATELGGLVERAAAELSRALTHAAIADPERLREVSAETLTGEQCALFDRVVAAESSHA